MQAVRRHGPRSGERRFGALGLAVDVDQVGMDPPITSRDGMSSAAIGLSVFGSARAARPARRRRGRCRRRRSWCRTSPRLRIGGADPGRARPRRGRTATDASSQRVHRDAPMVERAAGARRRSRGRAATADQSAAGAASHQCATLSSCRSMAPIIEPQLGVGSPMPTPKNDSVISASVYAGSDAGLRKRDAERFGGDVRAQTRAGDAPDADAAATKSRVRHARHDAADQSRRPRPSRHPDHDHDRGERAVGSTSSGSAARIASSRYSHGSAMNTSGAPITRRVDPASEESGDAAEQRGRR